MSSLFVQLSPHLQVTKHIKLMPQKFTNLPAPKSAFVERFVKLTEDELHAQRGMKKPADAREAFGALLRASLGKVGGADPLTGRQEEALKQAGIIPGQQEWASAARKSMKEHGL